MALTLRLSGGSMPAQTKLLTAGTLSIGRGAGNDWVLADPDRHLSKTHCVISAEAGRYVLTDLSTNGVHINGARQATTRDSRVVLTDGDDFRLGEYTVTVTEVEDSRPGQRPSAPAMGRGSFGGGGLDPFDAPPGTAEGGSPLDIDPLDDPLGRPPDPAFRHPVVQPLVGRRTEDPFDVSDDMKHHVADPDDDLFRGVKPAVEWQGPTQADHADAPRHAMAAPRVRQPAASLSADDFDALIGDLSDFGPQTPAAPPPPQARAMPPPMHDPLADLDNLFAPQPPATIIPEIHAPPAPRPVAPPQPGPRPADPFAEPDVIETMAPRAPRPPPARPVSAPPAAAAAPTAPAASGGDGQAALLAFLDGAGVGNLPVANADPEAMLRAVGQVFRAMTEGLREVLMSRTAIKGEMRVEQTLIRARDNNALKFSVTVDEAVAALLNPQRQGYMPPLAATKEAFADLKSHELAVMVGIKTAMTGLLARFNPAELEKRMAQGLLGAVLPAARKARYWDSFRQVYGDIVKESEDDFQAVFGREFARAYTEQTRKE